MVTPPTIARIYTVVMHHLKVLNKILTRRAAKLNRYLLQEAKEEVREELTASSVTMGMIIVRQLCSDRNMLHKRMFRTRGRTSLSCRITTTRRELRRQT